MKSKKLVIIGAGETAEIAYEYFTHDSPYDVAAFAVEKAYATKDRLCGLPVIYFENIEKSYSPGNYQAFVAVSYIQLNRVRARLFKAAKEKGYSLASYISSKAFVWHNATIGENCFILENNVVQYRVKIGANVIFWSGNHVGHQTV